MASDTRNGHTASEAHEPVSVGIVEDNADIAALYVALAESRGMRISFIAYSGREAIKAFEAAKKPPDVILIDQRMPIMSGIEAMREILAICPTVRFIFISADESRKEEALEAGARAFLQKPASRREIIETMTRVLDSGISFEKQPAACR